MNVYRRDQRWLKGHSNQPDDDDDDDDDVDETVEQNRLTAIARCLDADDVSDEFTRSQDDSLKVIKIGEGFGRYCGLTGIKGKFEGGGEWVKVPRSDTDNPTWQLWVGSKQTAVAGRAVCFTPRY